MLNQVHFILCQVFLWYLDPLILLIIDGPISDLEQPVAKLFIAISNSHVLCHLKLHNVVVERRGLEASSHSLSSLALGHNRWSLPWIASKYYYFSSEWAVICHDISEESFDHSNGVLVDVEDLIPDD